MDQGRVSVSYAKALLDWAVDNNLVEEVYAQTECLLEFIDSNPEFLSLLNTPMASLTKKIEAISNILKSCSPLLVKFVVLLVKNRREKQLRSAVLMFQTLYRKKQNIIKASVESAKEINEGSKKQIHNFLVNRFGGKVEVDFTIKPEIIGGFVLSIDNLMVDKSVKGEIEKLKRKLIGTEN